jgi:hypothetical protein
LIICYIITVQPWKHFMMSRCNSLSCISISLSELIFPLWISVYFAAVDCLDATFVFLRFKRFKS